MDYNNFINDGNDNINSNNINNNIGNNNNINNGNIGNNNINNSNIGNNNNFYGNYAKRKKPIVLFVFLFLIIGVVAFVAFQKIYNNDNFTNKECSLSFDSQNYDVQLGDIIEGYLYSDDEEKNLCKITNISSSNTEIMDVEYNKEIVDNKYTFYVTGKNKGNAKLNVTCENKVKMSILVKVYDSMVFDEKSYNITEGKKITLNLRLKDKEDLKIVSSDKSVIVSDVKVSDIDPELVTVTLDGVKDGNSVITAQTKSGFFQKTEVTVHSRTRTLTMYFGNSNYSIKEGEEILATLTSQYANNELCKIKSITSSDNSIASVRLNNKTSNNKYLFYIKGIKKGNVVLTATCENNQQVLTNVRVTEKDVNNLPDIILPDEINENAIERQVSDNIDFTVLEMMKGQSIILKPFKTSNEKITYTSSNTKILQVDQNGKITGKNVGYATVTIQTSNVIKKIEVHVKVPVHKISFESQNYKMLEGEKKALSATISPKTATNKILDWSSSNTKIATVDNKGIVTAKSSGTVTITVKSSDGPTAKINLTVEKLILAKSITIDSKDFVITKGNTKKLTATISPSNATNKNITWESSNTNVATVDKNGNVTAKNEGKATITAKSPDGPSAKIIVTVQGKILVKSIALDSKDFVLNKGNTKKLTATISPSNAANKNITWESSNTNVATVDKNGNITAKKEGKTTITAKSPDGPSAKITVTVKNITSAKDMCNYIKNSGAKSISYEDFREFYKDKKDDYYLMKQTHHCANTLNLPVVLTTAKRYDIYHIHNEGSILVQTSTNLGGSSIYIHDEEGIAFNTKDAGLVFWIRENKTKVQLTTEQHNTLKNKLKGKIKTGSNAKIPELAGYGNALVEVVDSQTQMYCRTNDIHTGCASQKDYFIVDNNGNVSGYIVWDFPNITEVNIYPIEKDTIIFQNAKIYNIVDPKSYSNRTDYMYINRGINVERSNVELKNIEHKYLNTNEKEINVMNVSYGGIITVNNAANIKLTNIKLRAMKSNATNNSSTYDLNINSAVNVTLKNVTIPDNQLTNTNLWHVIGTNRTKYVVCDGCKLNGYDAHKGVHNLTIKNSVLGKDRITVIGSGTLQIDNTTFKGSNEMVQLKDGYGSTWHGVIKINNCKFYPTFKNLDNFEIPTTATRIIWFRLNDADYGYNIHLPNVQVNNLVVYNNPSAIYIYPNDKYHSGCGSGVTDLRYSTYYCYYANKKNPIRKEIYAPSSITYKNITDQNGNSIIDKVKNYYMPF